AAAIEPSLRGTTQRAPAGERAIAYRPPRAAMRHCRCAAIPAEQARLECDEKRVACPRPRADSRSVIAMRALARLQSGVAETSIVLRFERLEFRARSARLRRERVAPTIGVSENAPDNGIRGGRYSIPSRRPAGCADVTSLRTTGMRELKLLQRPAAAARRRTAGARADRTDREDI
ncbi:hypothetical protein KGP93_38295, partial [Burkholderia multivorans]|nr:hypothetical protein [Burkholderia multivorans]